MQAETRYGNQKLGTPNRVTIAWRWESVEVNGAPSPFSITPDRLHPAKSELRGDQAGQAVFRFSGENVVVQSGLKSQWLTVTP
jgi:hypothetical protein